MTVDRKSFQDLIRKILNSVKFQMLLIYIQQRAEIISLGGSFHLREQESWLAQGHMTKVGANVHVPW